MPSKKRTKAEERAEDERLRREFFDKGGKVKRYPMWQHGSKNWQMLDNAWGRRILTTKKFREQEKKRGD